MEKDNNEMKMVEEQMKDLNIQEKDTPMLITNNNNNNNFEKNKTINGNVVHCDIFETIERLLARLKGGQ